ncbi:hypothetical protein PAHAL_9G470100 [Panicum hallii]|jgi:hypothetical protein|uniref:Uncharacterized protein n=1 Tax=Panicum hallii TaxID=206008 RepID=A0A2T8I4X5_9POAL|nr:hypothetical protein PAHAL_9G470100 [Panicum hallii]
MKMIAMITMVTTKRRSAIDGMDRNETSTTPNFWALLVLCMATFGNWCLWFIPNLLELWYLQLNYVMTCIIWQPLCLCCAFFMMARTCYKCKALSPYYTSQIIGTRLMCAGLKCWCELLIVYVHASFPILCC